MAWNKCGVGTLLQAPQQNPVKHGLNLHSAEAAQKSLLQVCLEDMKYQYPLPEDYACVRRGSPGLNDRCRVMAGISELEDMCIFSRQTSPLCC